MFVIAKLVEDADNRFGNVEDLSGRDELVDDGRRLHHD